MIYLGAFQGQPFAVLLNYVAKLFELSGFQNQVLFFSNVFMLLFSVMFFFHILQQQRQNCKKKKVV